MSSLLQQQLGRSAHVDIFSWEAYCLKEWKWKWKSNLPICFAINNNYDLWWVLCSNSRAGLRTSTVHLRSRTGHHTADLEVWCQQSALQFNPCSFESHFMVIYWIIVRAHRRGEQLFSQLIIVSWFEVCVKQFLRELDKDIFSLGGIITFKIEIESERMSKDTGLFINFCLCNNFLQ